MSSPSQLIAKAQVAHWRCMYDSRGVMILQPFPGLLRFARGVSEFVRAPSFYSCHGCSSSIAEVIEVLYEFSCVCFVWILFCVSCMNSLVQRCGLVSAYERHKTTNLATMKTLSLLVEPLAGEHGLVLFQKIYWWFEESLNFESHGVLSPLLTPSNVVFYFSHSRPHCRFSPK